MKNLHPLRFFLPFWIAFLGLLPTAQASHYIGSDITYECLGGNQYNIQLRILIDCNNGIGSGLFEWIDVESPTCGTYSTPLTLLSGYPMDITPVCGGAASPCVSGVGYYGVELFVYQGVYTLPSNCPDWTISWASCCRSGQITTLSAPSSQSHHVRAKLNNSTVTCNSSPNFVDYPLTMGCVNDTLYHTFAATDSDGDSLVYSLTNAWQSLTQSVNYNMGYSPTQPFSGSTSIDPQTGLMTIVANQIQVGTVCVKVEEYRNGVKIGEVLRDVQIFINPWPNDVPRLHSVNGSYFIFNSHTITAGSTLQLNLAFQDDEAAQGTQALTTTLSPTNPSGVTLASNNTTATLQWTPTNAQVGWHYLHFRTKDNACILNGVNDFTIAVQVLQGSNTYFFADTMPLGETSFYCLADSIFYTCDTLENAVLTFLNDSCFYIFADVIGTDTTCFTDKFGDLHYFALTIENGVWPGDTDDDGTVNNFDLLNIGLAYNSTGVPRNPASILWNGYLTPDWGSTTPVSNLDYKHIDADGNGTINADDTAAIVQNWGLSYDKNGGSNGTPLYLAVDSIVIVNDSFALIPVMLGDAQTPISNIYGIAFTIQYSANFAKDSSVHLLFDNSWIGSLNSDMISIQKDFYPDERIEVAITRTNGSNSNGFGQIATMCITIQDDIMRIIDSVFVFDVLNVRAIDASEMDVAVTGLSQNLYLDSLRNTTHSKPVVPMLSTIRLYPNPANDRLFIELPTPNDLLSVQIFDCMGRLLLQQIPTAASNQTLQINTTPLQTGVYLVRIKTSVGQITRKVTIFR